MSQIDLIGIGAINLDYIFSDPKKSRITFPNQTVEKGSEQLNWNSSGDHIDLHINDLSRCYNNRKIQLGGSALLALRSAKAVDSNICVSYVGVCGKPNDNDRRLGFSYDLNIEFSYIDRQEWFFNLNNSSCIDKDEYADIGKAAVILNEKNSRESISISPGANDYLVKFIKEKEADFVLYLSKSRWIHITSLSNFDSFLCIAKCIKKAKLINPSIIISCDLGYEYYKTHFNALAHEDTFKLFDYNFISSYEYEQIVINPNTSYDNKLTRLSKLFKDNHSGQNVIIEKNIGSHNLFTFYDGDLLCHTFHHDKIKPNKIVDDTGAGDFFAGGFIAAMLSKKLLTYQPAPVKMGAMSAVERLKSESLDDACKSIAEKAIKIFRRYMYPFKLSKIRLVWYRMTNNKDTVLYGIILGIISSIIVEYIFKYIFKWS